MSDTHLKLGPDVDAKASASETALERFARRAFAEDVERIDAETRASLAAARRRAVELADERLSIQRYPGQLLMMRPRWAVAGVAATLLLALAFALRLGAPPVTETSGFELAGDRRDVADPGRFDITDDDIGLVGPTGSIESPADLEILTAGDVEVLEVLEEDLEFYAWLEQQPELASVGEGGW